MQVLGRCLASNTDALQRAVPVYLDLYAFSK